MNSGDNSSSRSTDGELSRLLRAFLAGRRAEPVTPTMWIDMQNSLLSHLGTESQQTIHSTLKVLKDERHCVQDDIWEALKSHVNSTLTRCERLQVLHALNESIFNNIDVSEPKKRRTVDGPSQGSPRKRLRRGENEEEGGALVGSEQSLRLDTFYLLRSRHIPNKKHTISLDEIVTAGADLTIICNFNFDVPWMWEAAPALQTSRKVLIIHGETEAEEREWKSFLHEYDALGRVRFSRPRTPPYGTVHSKVFLLFYATGCRVCIHTANMVAGDWDFKTQGAYVRDFPLQESSGGSSETAANADMCVREDDFKTQLDRYFRHVVGGELRDEVTRALAKYDFSSAGVSLVSSVPGVHKGYSKTHFGHARLRALLSKEAIHFEGSRSIAVCQFSSLGSIQQKWLEEEFKETLFSSNTRCEPRNVVADDKEIKLVFPTLNQVRESNEGLQAGASLPVRGKNINREHILNKLHKWDTLHSGYAKAMPHIKTIVRYPASKPHSPSWIFLGSFNLSVAAWGRMQGARKNKCGWDRLNILSFEIGVLFSPSVACAPICAIDGSIKYPLLSATQRALWDEARRAARVSLDLTNFRDFENTKANTDQNRNERTFLTIPLPYRIPPPKYNARDTPWTTEHCTLG